MKHERKPGREAAKNIVSFPFTRDANCEERGDIKAHRQAHVKARLQQSLELGENSPIAAAAVLLRADGSIETTAIGIEPIVSNRMASELDRLARLARWHAQRHQTGSASLVLLTTGLLAAATYLNTIAWLDAMLCMTCHAFAHWLGRREATTT